MANYTFQDIFSKLGGGDGGGDSPKTMRQVMEYLFQLNEWLRYMFAHIGQDNLDATLKEEISNGGLGAEWSNRIEDAEGNISQILHSINGLIVSVNNNRLEFTDNGLTIINDAGEKVLDQTSDTGDLTIIGMITALTFYAMGNVFMPFLPTTTKSPNLYVETAPGNDFGRLYRSTWTPGSGTEGGATVWWDSTNIKPGQQATATVSTQGGYTPQSFTYRLYRDGTLMSTKTSATASYSFTPTLGGVYSLSVDVLYTNGVTSTGTSDALTVGSGTTNMQVIVYADRSEAKIGDVVTWYADAVNWVGSVTFVGYNIYRPNGTIAGGGAGTNGGMSPVDVIGNWWCEVIAYDDLGQKTGKGGYVTVKGSSSGGNPTSGTTNTSSVRIRANPNANANIRTTLSSAGTPVVITGGLVADSLGGSIPWWPVRYTTGDGDDYSGYIRSDLLNT